MLFRVIVRSVVSMVVGLPLLGSAPPVMAQEGPFAHLEAAIYEMRESKLELKAERFNRHRVEAVRDLDAAIAETEKAIKEAKIELRRYEGPKDPKVYYKAYRDFPHLRHAVVELREAKLEIERAKRREFTRAIAAIDIAINRVEAALKDEK
jgi:hypothetical protein